MGGRRRLLDGWVPGRTVSLPVNGFTAIGSAVNSVEIFQVGGADVAPEVVTITLALPNQPPVTTDAASLFTTNSSVTALIEWGCGSVRMSAVVDVVNGCGFSIAADWVRVTGTYRTTAAAGLARVTMGATIAYGASTRGYPPQLSMQPATDAELGALTYSRRVPSFAKTVKHIWAPSVGVGPNRVRVLDGLAATVMDIQLGVGSHPTELPIAVSGVSVTVNLAGAPTFSQLIFGLCL